MVGYFFFSLPWFYWIIIRIHKDSFQNEFLCPKTSNPHLPPSCRCVIRKVFIFGNLISKIITMLRLSYFKSLSSSSLSSSAIEILESFFHWGGFLSFFVEFLCLKDTDTNDLIFLKKKMVKLLLDIFFVTQTTTTELDCIRTTAKKNFKQKFKISFFSLLN